MTTLLKTETGSLYELDMPNKRIRRIEGMGPCPPRMGEDGVWKTFESAHVLDETEAYQHLVVTWKWDIVKGTPIARSTVTSRIVEVREK